MASALVLVPLVADTSATFKGRIDGSHRRALARGDRPAWSSDGRYIVFDREVAARKGVFIMRSNGRGLRRLTASASDRQPSFSPDGGHVAFLRDLRTPSPVTEWHTIDPDGRNDVLVATHATGQLRYGAPQWTPDGMRLAGIREQTHPMGAFPAYVQALVTVPPTGGDERVEFTFRRELVGFTFGYTYYAGDFSWQPR